MQLRVYPESEDEVLDLLLELLALDGALSAAVVEPPFAAVVVGIVGTEPVGCMSSGNVIRKVCKPEMNIAL